MNIQFFLLKEIKESKKFIYLKVINWIKNLKPELDYEDWRVFWEFVKQNIKLEYPFQVFIIYNKSLNDVIGIASLIPDDQNVGKELNLKGIWLGWVNIKREYRNMGYGKKLLENIDNYLNNLINKPIQVNLFSNNPIAIYLYEKIGFKYSGLKILREWKNNRIYSKIYSKTTETKKYKNFY